MCKEWVKTDCQKEHGKQKRVAGEEEEDQRCDGKTVSNEVLKGQSGSTSSQLPKSTRLFLRPSRALNAMTITTPQMDNSTFTDNQTLTNRSFGDVVCLSELEPAVMTSHYMYLYVSMLFIGIGLIGNSLNIAVFSSKAMRKSSSNVYLLVLAVSDSLYLVSVFFTKILTTLRCMYFNDSQIDIVNRSEFMCKFLQYVLDFFSDFSTCLILAFTVERYVAVYAPIRFKQSCTVRKARIISAVIFTVITLFITPYHVMFMGLYRDYDVCIVLLAHEATFTILYVVEALVFRVVPVFVIVVLNVFIIVKVSSIQRTKKRQKRENRRTLQQQQQKSESTTGSRACRKDDKGLQTTIMLILVSTSYILVFIPVLVHFVVLKLQRSKVVDVSYVTMLTIQNYTRTLYIAGFAINFFLYTVSGTIFRKQLKKLLGCRTERHAVPSSSTHVTRL
ncbi:hypothetical protein LSAT2_008467 [Lamellibrachia satsuma]|nr:hypothetical protein LSAT2_008467 [Lamellibrachia satsuma]